MDFKEINKQGFETLQFEDGAIYFGELAYRNQETQKLVHNFEELAPEEQAKCHRVRQGRGVQLFGRTQESDLLCKYAGEWLNDKKNGEGHCVYPDGSEYKGTFAENVF